MIVLLLLFWFISPIFAADADASLGGLQEGADLSADVILMSASIFGWLLANCLKIESKDDETWFLLQHDSPFFSNKKSFDALFLILQRLQASILGTNYMYTSMKTAHWITIVYSGTPTDGSISGFLFMNLESRLDFPLEDWQGSGIIKRPSKTKSRPSTPVSPSPQQPSTYFHVTAVCKSVLSDAKGLGRRLMDFQKVIVRRLGQLNQYKYLIVIDAIDPLQSTLYPDWGFKKIDKKVDGCSLMALVVHLDDTESVGGAGGATSGAGSAGATSATSTAGGAGSVSFTPISEMDLSFTDAMTESLNLSKINVIIAPHDYDKIIETDNPIHLIDLQYLHYVVFDLLRKMPVKPIQNAAAVVDILSRDVQSSRISWKGYNDAELQRLFKFRTLTKFPKITIKKSVSRVLPQDFLEALSNSFTVI
jgi:hypothetical protein